MNIQNMVRLQPRISRKGSRIIEFYKIIEIGKANFQSREETESNRRFEVVEVIINEKYLR